MDSKERNILITRFIADQVEISIRNFQIKVNAVGGLTDWVASDVDIDIEFVEEGKYASSFYQMLEDNNIKMNVIETADKLSDSFALTVKIVRKIAAAIMVKTSYMGLSFDEAVDDSIKKMEASQTKAEELANHIDTCNDDCDHCEDHNKNDYE
ncbi:MAG: hypothetical protein ACYC2U_04635 [Candidatus Amoebophilus sp.]